MGEREVLSAWSWVALASEGCREETELEHVAAHMEDLNSFLSLHCIVPVEARWVEQETEQSATEEREKQAPDCLQGDLSLPKTRQNGRESH